MPRKKPKQERLTKKDPREGIRRAAAAAKQLHEKRGPYYDKWLEGRRRWAERIVRGEE